MHRFGCIPDTLDQRDYLFAARRSGKPLPAAYDVLSLLSSPLPVLDQGELGSCTAHGVTEALRFDHLLHAGTDLPLSRLQLYYDSRALEGTIASDAGAQIRDVVKSAAKTGVAPEKLWPYNVDQFEVRPTKKVYTAAKKDEALSYARVAISADALKAALFTGHPVVIGISVYESFEADKAAATGVIPMPKKKEQMLGGHCMLATGWDDETSTFTVRNSWGPDWGDKGNCHIPYAYLGSAALGADYWSIKTVSF